MNLVQMVNLTWSQEQIKQRVLIGPYEKLFLPEIARPIELLLRKIDR